MANNDGGSCGQVNYGGEYYPTIVIGTQCWLSRNFNIGTMIAEGTNQTSNALIEKYCYDNNPEHCGNYGGFYHWNEMMQYSTTEGTQGICPPGWHIPSDAEWSVMAKYIDPTVQCIPPFSSGTDAGYKMKTIYGWTGGSGSDTIGFSALAAGFYTGTFTGINTTASFWSFSGAGVSVKSWELYNYSSRIFYIASGKSFGYSVRCVKD